MIDQSDLSKKEVTMNLTIAHCYNYLRSLDLDSLCGIRGNPYETLIVRVAKFTTGKSQGFAYAGGDILWTGDGNAHRLSPQTARIAQAFEDCKTSDFDAFPVDEDGLTYGAYIQLPGGKWFEDYRRLDSLKAHSPDVYRKYTRKRRYV
jgi:hypothetical protein